MIAPVPGLDRVQLRALNDVPSIARFVLTAIGLEAELDAGKAPWPSLSDDSFAFGGRLLGIDDALEKVGQHLDCVVGEQTVALSDALDRVLARPIVAERAVPPHNNSAVDGYAVRFADLVLQMAKPGCRFRDPAAGRRSAFGHRPGRNRGARLHRCCHAAGTGHHLHAGGLPRRGGCVIVADRHLEGRKLSVFAGEDITSGRNSALPGHPIGVLPIWA